MTERSFDGWRMRIERSPERTVMFVSGEIDLSNAGRLGEWLAVIINEGPPAVEIDLSRMTFMDSTGISAFVTARALCDGKQVGFSLTNVQPNTRRVIAAVGLEDFLSVQP